MVLLFLLDVGFTDEERYTLASNLCYQKWYYWAVAWRTSTSTEHCDAAVPTVFVWRNHRRRADCYHPSTSPSCRWRWFEKNGFTQRCFWTAPLHSMCQLYIQRKWSGWILQHRAWTLRWFWTGIWWFYEGHYGIFAKSIIWLRQHLACRKPKKLSGWKWEPEVFAVGCCPVASTKTQQVQLRRHALSLEQWNCMFGTWTVLASCQRKWSTTRWLANFFGCFMGTKYANRKRW